MDAVRSERVSMEAPEFARAYGNIPDLSGQKLDRVDLSNWGACADPGSRALDPVALAFSVAPDGSSSAGAGAGRPAAGLGHGGVVDHRPGPRGRGAAVGGRGGEGVGQGEVVDHRPGTGWLVPRVLEVAARWDPCVVVMNPAGAAGAFEKELAERKFSVKPGPGERLLQLTGMREYAQACGALADDVRNGRWRHLGQGPVDAAVAVARMRPLADLWALALSRAGGGTN